MHTCLNDTVHDLLETPGATKVVLVWMDPATERVFHTEVQRDTELGDILDADGRELYMVGEFNLREFDGGLRVEDAVNGLRRRAGLSRVPAPMLSLLRPGDREGDWCGAIKVGAALN